MLFFEYSFLFVFLPCVLAVYYAAPPRLRNAWILAASLAFYATSSWSFLPLLLGSIAVDYLAGARIAASTVPRTRRCWLGVSLACNLGVLAFFKYGGFFSINVNALLSLADRSPILALDLALPIGISFYTFQSMSYTIDLYRGRVSRVRNPVDFGAYVALFPQLIAGPIVRFSHLETQLRERVHSSSRFAHGLFTFSVGLGKKLLVADTLATLAAPLFADSTPGLLDAWAAMLLFAGQIYFDFSGYSDMAVGLGRLLGFELPVNFDAPYRATSFSDFWRRWHITLSQWLRDYLYIPLGGNRKGALRTQVNLMLTMLLGGLWHGASWNFVLWGGLHGAFLMIERGAAALGVPSPPVWLRRLLVFAAVVVAWTPFKLETFAATEVWLLAMAGTAGVGAVQVPAALGVLAFLALVWMPIPRMPTTDSLGLRRAVAAACLLLISVAVGYGRIEPSPFLYFRF
ncbi:MAG: MBOAT family protein [Myxococcales bacterium]|nr:MBOAT family protein [Myxococcales bacterium]